MKKLTKIILILFCVGLVSGIGTYLYVFHKPHRNLENEKPAYIYAAEKLVTEYTADEMAGNKKFADKALDVSGEVVEKNVSDKQITFVLYDAMGGVSCSFDSTYIAENKDKLIAITQGQHVTIRGKCDGLDMILGVVLTCCVIPDDK